MTLVSPMSLYFGTALEAVVATQLNAGAQRRENFSNRQWSSQNQFNVLVTPDSETALTVKKSNSSPVRQANINSGRSSRTCKLRRSFMAGRPNYRDSVRETK